MRKHVWWLLAIAAACAAPVWAHHSFAAQYDARKPITLHGTVTRFELIMPHSWVRLEGSDEKGKAGLWSVEFGNPNQLFRRGWTKTTLKPGMEVTIEGSRARDGSNTVNGTKIRLSDGTVLFNQTAPGQGPPAPQRN